MLRIEELAELREVSRDSVKYDLMNAAVGATPAAAESGLLRKRSLLVFWDEGGRLDQSEDASGRWQTMEPSGRSVQCGKALN